MTVLNDEESRALAALLAEPPRPPTPAFVEASERARRIRLAGSWQCCGNTLPVDRACSCGRRAKP